MHQPRASTSRTSLDDLARDEAGTSGGARTAGDKPLTARAESPAPSAASAKGKERDWSVELAVLAPDGPDERAQRGEADGAEHGASAVKGGGAGQDGLARGAPAAASERHGGAPRPASSSDAPTPLPTRPLEPAVASSSPPPPAPEQPARPARPPLQSILKRPELARPASSQGRSLASSTPLPLLSTAAAVPLVPPAADAALPLTPTHGTVSLDPPTPDSVDEAKDKLAAAHPHTVLFSTPGTTTSVLPLSSPSRLSHHSGYSSSAAEHGAPNDFTGTFRSWKSSVMGRKSGVYEKKRLAELGFDEELSRDYDFFASFGITICNIGGLPGASPLSLAPSSPSCTSPPTQADVVPLPAGTTLGVLTALEAGGGSMYAIAWPLSGLFMMSLAAVLGEMASTWPVAGAMFTWVFRLCRSRKGLNPWARYASWVVGSLLLCSHILLQVRRRSRLSVSPLLAPGRLVRCPSRTS